MAVRTQKHEIFNLGIGALLLAIDDVFESRRALTRYLQTDGKWFAGRSASIGFLFCQIAERIAAVIDPFRRLGAGALSDVLLGVNVGAFFLRREVPVSFAFVDQPPRRSAMLFGVRGLKNQLLVVIQTQPLQTLNDRPGRFFR